MFKLFKHLFAVSLASLLFQQTAFSADLDAYLLTAEEFKAKIAPRYGEVLDLRGDIDENFLYPLNRIAATLEDSANLERHLDKQLKRKATVLAFDQDGSKIVQLQQMLERKGIKNYYFLKGGVDGVSTIRLVESNNKVVIK